MEIELEICSICQDNIEGLTNLMTTECNHKFHSTCYLRYVNTTKKVECPMCRNNCLGEEEPSSNYRLTTISQNQRLDHEYRIFLNEETTRRLEAQRVRNEEIRLNLERMNLHREMMELKLKKERENMKTYDPEKYFLLKKRKNIRNILKK